MQKNNTIIQKKLSNLRKPPGTGAIVGAAIVIYGLWAIDNFYSTREKAFARAKELSFSNGIINLGSGAGHYLSASAKKYALDSAVAANVDIGPDEGNIPNYYQANLNFRLPFEDNQFSCFFASHCLEHIPDWESALQEWLRIAGRGIVVLPHPLNIGQMSDKTHTRYVSQGWINQVKSYPGVEVYD